MSKRHSFSVEKSEEEAKKAEIKDKIPQTRKLVLQVDAKYKVTGRHSGQEYLFNGAGSANDVNNKDVEWMLSLRQGSRQCCGGGPEGNVVFRLAE